MLFLKPGQVHYLLTAILLLMFNTAQAQSGHEGEGHAQEHSFHSNMIAAFLGVTSKTRREGSLTLGLEYNRRISEHFGMGVLAEHVFSDHGFDVYAVGFAYFHSSWKVYAAPGVEKSKEHDAEFLLRLGAEYIFPIGGGFELSPQIDIDFVGGDQVLVIGLSIGKGF